MPGPRPKNCVNVVCAMRWRGGGGACAPARSTSWPGCWMRPARSWRKRADVPLGITPDGATRRSLHDGDAADRQGRLGRPVEFGRKAHSSATMTASSWITLWSRAIRPTRDWPPVAPSSRTRWAHTGHGHRRPWLRRSQGRPSAHRPRRHLGVIPREANPRRRAARKNIERRSPHRQMANRGRRGRISCLKRSYTRTAPASTVRGCPDLDRTRDPRP